MFKSKLFLAFWVCLNFLRADVLINAIVWEKQTLSVIGSAPLQVSFEQTAGGYRLLLSGAVLNIPHPQRLYFTGDLLTSIVYDQRSLNPGLVEIQLKTAQKLQPAVFRENGGNSFIVKFTALPPPKTPPTGNLRLGLVEIVSEDDNSLRLTFFSTGNVPLNYKVSRFTAPERLALDFPATALGIDKEIALPYGPAARLRASQFTWEPLQARVVLDLNTNYAAYEQAQDSPYTLRVLVTPSAAEKNFAASTAAVTVSPVSPAVQSVTKSAAAVTASAPPQVSVLKGARVAIIAGHGGSDPGAISKRGHKEKDLTLAIAKRLQALLREKGAVALLNREGDEGMSLDKQAQFAESNKADLLVSVHLNSFVNETASGAETFYYKPVDQALAKAVHEELLKITGQKDRGLRKSMLHNLNHTTMPGVLIEPLFMSNPKEEKLVLTPEFQQKLAQGIVSGLERHLENKNK
ncbi:MAG: N-acetylmuramoyl-L-alanine amidase [Candidatus Margulisbacteria bacterium]|jgi:N-acetylmuramoyl-L-alanine amidase|nr:N-acetylmuramoyl-L-alanine amidase [Candidatus Margulisiibacteriota bacterium]